MSNARIDELKLKFNTRIDLTSDELSELAYSYCLNKEYKIAAELYQKLANAGNAKAAYNLGRLYLIGKGVDQNDEQAFKYFGKAVNDYPGAMAGFGRLYLKRGDITAACYWFLLAAIKLKKNDDINAHIAYLNVVKLHTQYPDNHNVILTLAVMEEGGYGCKVTLKPWWERAGITSNPLYHFFMGVSYEFGHGFITQNLFHAESHYIIAAKSKSPEISRRAKLQWKGLRFHSCPIDVEKLKPDIRANLEAKPELISDYQIPGYRRKPKQD